MPIDWKSRSKSIAMLANLLREIHRNHVQKSMNEKKRPLWDHFSAKYLYTLLIDAKLT